MTSEELKQELDKQREREGYENIVEEYLRIKKIVADGGRLTHDEASAIALQICKSKCLFDVAPSRNRW